MPPGTTEEGRVYVVLVNFGDPADTLECLETLFRLDYRDFQVVVVDNGATDASVAALTEWTAGARPARVAGPVGLSLTTTPTPRPIRCSLLDSDAIDSGAVPAASASGGPELTVIRSTRNRGFAGGNNLGLRYGLLRGDAQWFWLLNNDTAVPPDSLRALVEHCAARPRLGPCGSTLVWYSAPGRLQALGGGRFNPWLGRVRLMGFNQPFRPGAAAPPAALDFVHGASMLVSRSFVETVGLLDERYFLYFEELDWSARAAARFQLGHAPGSIVFHKDGSSAGSATRHPARRSRLADYHGLRSRLIFTMRHRPWALPTVWLGLAVVLLNRIRRRQWDRVPMILGLMAGRL